jgi:hypothetical protein
LHFFYCCLSVSHMVKVGKDLLNQDAPNSEEHRYCISPNGTYMILWCIPSPKQSHTRAAFLILSISQESRCIFNIITAISLTYVACIVGLGFINPHLIVSITFTSIAWHCHLCPGNSLNSKIDTLNQSFYFHLKLFGPLHVTVGGK